MGTPRQLTAGWFAEDWSPTYSPAELPEDSSLLLFNWADNQGLLDTEESLKQERDTKIKRKFKNTEPSRGETIFLKTNSLEVIYLTVKHE